MKPMADVTSAQHRRPRLGEHGVLTPGGRMTLLIVISGFILLAQAWQLAHRYGQRATSRAASTAAPEVIHLPEHIKTPDSVLTASKPVKLEPTHDKRLPTQNSLQGEPKP